MVVEQGRAAFQRQEWNTAYAELSALDDLGGEDLERLAIAANLSGRDDACIDAWERAHRRHLDDHDEAAAAQSAFWAGFTLLLRGRTGPAGGWLARSERVAANVDGDCAVRGFLLLPQFLDALGEGDTNGAVALAARIVEVATTCDDGDLLAIGRLCQGEAAVAHGDTAAGMRLLDDAMVSVTTGEVSPILAGIVYCAVIEECVNVFDLARAAQWTDALVAWCARQPDLVPYRGQCLVHRSQVLQAQGAWNDAVDAADEANRRLADAAHPALGAALYQVGELHRLRGELAAAERSYREASRHGREPAPGLALLRLAQGQVGAAVTSIRRLVQELRGSQTHPTMLAAAVEVLLAAGDLTGARDASDELRREVDGDVVAPYVRAMAEYSSGSVLLAEGDPTTALADLRRAAATWRELDLPYESARAGVQVSRACRALGDHDAADWQLETAQATFERLGARTDLALTGRLARASGSIPLALTDRQCEVLRIVATGRSNREVATELGISEHTVARHLQNIFTRLDLPSRSAATAYAHEHGLV